LASNWFHILCSDFVSRADSSIGITNKVVTNEELDMIYENSLGHYLHWRHQTPKKGNEGIIFGICKSREMTEFSDKDGTKVRGIDLGFELLKITDEHEKAISIIEKYQKLGKNIGISVGKQKFVDNSGKVVASYPFDWSLTDTPFDEATHTGVVTYMEAEEEKKLNGEIDELHKELDSKTGKVQELEKEISSLKGSTISNTEFEGKVKEITETITTAYKTKIEELESRIRKVQEDAERKPLLVEIAEFEDQFLIDNLYSNMPLKDLSKRLVELKENRSKTTTPVVESFENSRKRVRENGNGTTVMDLIRKADPDLAEQIAKGEFK